MKYIRYPRGNDNRWVPISIREIEVQNIKILKYGLVSKNGFCYNLCQAEISDEDALYLVLRIDQSVKGSVKISSNPF